MCKGFDYEMDRTMNQSKWMIMYVYAGEPSSFGDPTTQTKHSQSFGRSLEDIMLSVQFISTQNVWLQQTGTDFTQTGSTTPNIVSGTVLFISYKIVNHII